MSIEPKECNKKKHVISSDPKGSFLSIELNQQNEFLQNHAKPTFYQILPVFLYVSVAGQNSCSRAKEIFYRHG
jgi:hypothetical protein